MVNRRLPHSPMNGRHPERPPATRRNLSHQRTQRTRFVAARRSWAARGLSSGRFAVAGTFFYLVLGGIIETTNQLV